MPRLTPDQDEVMTFSCLGFSAQEIATFLDREPEEVKQYLAEVMHLFGASSKLEACVIYLRHGGDR